MESASSSGRPVLYAIAGAVAVGIVWAVLSAVLDLHIGLLVVAAFGGWLIGSALRPVGQRRSRLALAIAAGAWVIGSVLDFVLSQVLLPNSTTPLGDRLAIGRYIDFTAATFDLVQALAIVILLVTAWRSAR